MTKEIILSKEEVTFLNKLMTMTGEEIYEEYGYKRDETFTFTVSFEDEIEADVKLVICEDDTPYIEGVLFENGNQIACTEPDYNSILGEYNFEYNDKEYEVIVKEREVA